jgi:nucleolar protein 56
LFRALKTKGNTPKYGLIYHSTFIGRADSKNKGRISRYLANKCSIATRIDSFSDDPSRLYGEKLREQVEERLKFYETGQSPRRNIDVMVEVSKQLRVGMDTDDDKDNKKKKKKKKDTKMDIDDDEEDDEPKSEKKKSKKEKKRKSDKMDVEVETPTKKSKKVVEKDDDDDDEEVEKSSKKAKKEEKKKKKDKKKSM